MSHKNLEYLHQKKRHVTSKTKTVAKNNPEQVKFKSASSFLDIDIGYDAFNLYKNSYAKSVMTMLRDQRKGRNTGRKGYREDTFEFNFDMNFLKGDESNSRITDTDNSSSNQKHSKSNPKQCQA